MSALDRESPELEGVFADGTRNVLLLVPPMDHCADDGCADLLAVDPPTEEDVLYVTFVDTPDHRLDEWRRRFGNDRPANMGFVSVGDPMRSAATTMTDDGSGGEVTVRTLSNPGDLTDLGIQISLYLSEWEGDGHRTVLCVDSITTLLQYADLQRVFRFLHVIIGRIRSTESVAHYHADPTAHDPQALNTLKTLFDGIVEWDGADWAVTIR